MISYDQCARNGARCQPPPTGVRDEAVEALLREVLGKPSPPAALVEMADEALTVASRAGARAMILAQMADGEGLLEIGHTLAEAADGHDPYDADEAVAADCRTFDTLTALSLLCRRDTYAGRRFDAEVSLLHSLSGEKWREFQRRRCEDAATALLVAVRGARQ